MARVGIVAVAPPFADPRAVPMRLAARTRRLAVVALAVFLGACLTAPSVDTTGGCFGSLDDAGVVSFRFRIATGFPSNSFTGRYQAYSNGNLVYGTALAGTIDGGNRVSFSLDARRRRSLAGTSDGVEDPPHLDGDAQELVAQVVGGGR